MGSPPGTHRKKQASGAAPACAAAQPYEEAVGGDIAGARGAD